MSYLPSTTGRKYNGHFDDGTPKRVRPNNMYNYKSSGGYNNEYRSQNDGYSQNFLPSIDNRSRNSSENQRATFTEKKQTGRPIDQNKPVRDFFKLVNQSAVDYEQQEQVVKKYYAFAFSKHQLTKEDPQLMKKIRHKSTIPQLQREKLQENAVKRVYHDQEFGNMRTDHEEYIAN